MAVKSSVVNKPLKVSISFKYFFGSFLISHYDHPVIWVGLYNSTVADSNFDLQHEENKDER